MPSFSPIEKSWNYRGDKKRRRRRRSNCCCTRMTTFRSYSCVVLILSSVLCWNRSHAAFSSSLSVRAKQKQHQQRYVVPSTTMLNSAPSSTTTRETNKNNKNQNKKKKPKKTKKKVPISSIIIPDKQKVYQQRLGAVFALGIMCQLAVRFQSKSDDMMISSLNWDATWANVLDATLATDSTQLFAGVVAELISGVIGSIAAVAIQSLFFSSFWKKDDNNSNDDDIVMQTSADVMTQTIEERNDDNDITMLKSSSQHKADEAEGVSRPLLEAAGVPQSLISFSNVVFAAVQPSELVKLGSRKRQLRFEEEQQNEEQLLLQQEQAQSKEESALYSSDDGVNDNNTRKIGSVDVVEIFADVTKWLEYNVLCAEFGETIALGEGLELGTTGSGAVLGMAAAVSTQLYADVLYGYFRYGPESRYAEVRSRTNLDWFSVYALRAVSSFVLFGVYEFSQGPVTRMIQGTLAGGVDGCIGSDNFDACMQTYINDNAPGASPEAQARALVTNLLMVGQRITDIAGDTNAADFEALFRAWTVSFISLIHNNFI